LSSLLGLGILQKQANIMAKMKIKCSKCNKEFYMEEWERKTCPNCGKVAVVPKAR